MLKDITIGQHFPGHSILHRCDPRLKLVATIAYIVVLFVAPNPLGLALSILLLAALYKVAQIPGKMILKSLKPIVPIVIFTAVLNLFFVTGQAITSLHIDFTGDRVTDGKISQIGKFDREDTETSSRHHIGHPMPVVIQA